MHKILFFIFAILFVPSFASADFVQEFATSTSGSMLWGTNVGASNRIAVGASLVATSSTLNVSRLDFQLRKSGVGTAGNIEVRILRNNNTGCDVSTDVVMATTSIPSSSVSSSFSWVSAYFNNVQILSGYTYIVELHNLSASASNSYEIAYSSGEVNANLAMYTRTVIGTQTCYSTSDPAFRWVYTYAPQINIFYPTILTIASTTVQVGASVNYGGLTSPTWLFLWEYGTTSGNYFFDHESMWSGYPTTVSFTPSGLPTGFIYMRVSMYKQIALDEVYELVLSSPEVPFQVSNSQNIPVSGIPISLDDVDMAFLSSITREYQIEQNHIANDCSNPSISFSDSFLCGFVDSMLLLFVPSQDSVMNLWSFIKGKLETSFPFSIFYGLNSQLVYQASISSTSSNMFLIPSEIRPDMSNIASTSPQYTLVALNENVVDDVIDGMYDIDNWFANNNFWQVNVRYLMDLALMFAFGLYVVFRAFNLLGFRLGGDVWYETVTDTETTGETRRTSSGYKGFKRVITRKKMT